MTQDEYAEFMITMMVLVAAQLEAIRKAVQLVETNDSIDAALTAELGRQTSQAMRLLGRMK